MRLIWLTFILSLTLIPYTVEGLDIDKLTDQYGEGVITLSKDIKISFHFNEEKNSYFAKASYKIQTLYLGVPNSDGLTQISFNAFQDLKLKGARFFRIDSTGAKKLVENVKVKYADVKDYYIQNIFYHDLKVKQFRSSIPLEENYALNYSYELRYNDLKFLTSFYFQNVFEAVEKVSISIKKHPDIDVSLFEFNLGDQIVKTEDELYIKYKAKELQRFKTRSSSVRGNYFLPHLIVSVKSVTVDEKKEEILASVESLYGWYSKLIGELKPDATKISSLSASIVKADMSDADKINAIFRWVQTNIQYVAFEDGIAGFKPAESHKVATSKFGDCKGIANLLVGLLNAQGFDARHAWLGTRANNYSYAIPSLVVDNHMICALNLNGKTYYLDGTSKSALWNVSPAHLEGKEVLVGKGSSYVVNKIPRSVASGNSIKLSGQISLTSDRPSIYLDVTLKGHFMRDFLSSISYSSNRNLKTVPFYFMQDYLDGINVEKISAPVIKSDQITFRISGTYLNYALGKKGLTIFPYLSIKEFHLLEEEDAPLYNSFPHTVEINIDMNIGKKYRIPALPASRKIGGGQYTAQFGASKVANKIKLKQRLEFNSAFVPSEGYEEWNKFLVEITKYNNYPLVYETIN